MGVSSFYGIEPVFDLLSYSHELHALGEPPLPGTKILCHFQPWACDEDSCCIPCVYILPSKKTVTPATAEGRKRSGAFL